jgi:hypothetical protein
LVVSSTYSAHAPSQVKTKEGKNAGRVGCGEKKINPNAQRRQAREQKVAGH